MDIIKNILFSLGSTVALFIMFFAMHIDWIGDILIYLLVLPHLYHE